MTSGDLPFCSVLIASTQIGPEGVSAFSDSDLEVLLRSWISPTWSLPVSPLGAMSVNHRSNCSATLVGVMNGEVRERPNRAHC